MADNVETEVFEADPPRELAERYAGWASGADDMKMGHAVGVATTRAGQVAADLFDLYVMEQRGQDFPKRVNRVKEWGYRKAAEFVASREAQAKIVGYRLDWGQQAARDGLCQAMWGHLRGTGLAARAKEFRIGERPFQRVRDHVEKEADKAIGRFARVLGGLLGAANGLDSAG